MNEQEMAVKLTEVEARSRSNTHRLDKMEEEFEVLNKLATAMEVMANEQKHIAETVSTMEDNLDTLKKEVKTIEEKPAKRWDGMVDKFIYGIVGALATALAGGLIYLLAVVK